MEQDIDVSGSRICAAFKRWQGVEDHKHINFIGAAHWLCTKRQQIYDDENVMMKGVYPLSLSKLSYTCM